MTHHARRVPIWLLTLAALASGWPTLTFAEPIPEVFGRLGLSRELAQLVGLCKLLGAVGLHLERWPRIREWSLAGFVFLFGGAVVLHVRAGDTPAQFAAPLVLFLLAGFTAALTPSSRDETHRLVEAKV